MVMMVRGRHVCLYGWSLLLLGLWKVGDNGWLLVVVSEDWANEGTMSKRRHVNSTKVEIAVLRYLTENR